MSNIPEQPAFTPQFCFNQTALRDFLRLSRSAIDDTISQNLNALATPSTNNPFNPTSTTVRQPTPATARKTALAPQTCSNFQNTALFPAWQSRSDLITYCASVATSPDPDDPTSILRQEEDAKARERVVDERLDPYSGRYFPREARTESLAALLRNEVMVEGIIRSRTWSVIGERCGSVSGTGYEEALEAWRRERREEKSGLEVVTGRR